MACLESAFLAHVSARLGTAPSLDREAQRGVAQLLKHGAPARLVGDSLYLGQVMPLAKTGRWNFVAPQRLFEPFPEESVGEAPLPGGSLSGKREEFLRGFDRLDPVARAVLEFEVPAKAVYRNGGELLFVGAYRDYFGPMLSPLGIHVYASEDVCGNPEARVRFRHLSLSALEMGLRIFFGDSAARLCMVRGILTDRQSNALHKAGYHGVGFPLGRLKVHGGRATPRSTVAHDAGHALQWSLRVPAWMRVAAGLLYDSALVALSKKQRDHRMDALGDLELGEIADLQDTLDTIREGLPVPTYACLLADFARRMDAEFPDTYESLDLARFRARLLSTVLSLRGR